MEGLISIIVPVYNSARYIRDCADSVIKQTYPHFEMILIDDGSEDNSRKICEELCIQDERILLINSRHEGVSAARNKGIEAARGKYLFFLDSDDMIHPQLHEVLGRLMEDKGAAVGTQRRYRMEKRLGKPKEWKKEDYGRVENDYLENEGALDCRIFASAETALFGIGGKMILKSALGCVRFSEKLSHGEDTLFVYQVLSGGADVVVLCRDWYCYRKHEGGTSTKLSVVSCNSIYKAECCIRNQELERGKNQNALLWELAILNTIIEWYQSGRQKKDDVLIKYARSRMDIETKQTIYRQVSEAKRREIHFLFYCYPFRRMHWIYPYVIHKIHRINQIYQPRLLYQIQRLSGYPGRYYRKVLNLIHIHRWRVRWAYKNIKWKTVWAGQMIWIIIRRSIWKVMDVYHVISHGREHLDGE